MTSAAPREKRKAGTKTTLTASTTLGSGVDGYVQAIGTAYNLQGLPYLYTSYSDADATTVLNQVENVYNGLGQMTVQYQSHSGAVDTDSTPEVQYGYSSIADGSRKTSLTYPDGRQIDFNYASGVDSDISRLTSISDNATSTVLESYKYLGLSAIVERDHPETGVNITYIGTGTGDGGDMYTGLDRFGRVVDQKWVTSGGTVKDEYQYGYDEDGNVLWKLNDLSADNSELYSYDNLNRLVEFQRGTLNSGVARKGRMPNPEAATRAAKATVTPCHRNLDEADNSISTWRGGVGLAGGYYSSVPIPLNQMPPPSRMKNRVATYHEFTLRRISRMVLFEGELHTYGIEGWWKPFWRAIRLGDLSSTITWRAARDGDALIALSCLAIGFMGLKVLPFASISLALKDFGHLAPFLAMWLTPFIAHFVFVIVSFVGAFQAILYPIKTHMVAFSGRASITICSMSSKSSAFLDFIEAVASQIERNENVRRAGGPSTVQPGPS